MLLEVKQWLLFSEKVKRRELQEYEKAVVQVEEAAPQRHSFPFRNLVSSQSSTQQRRPRKMSLPRSDYDPRRVCLNPFPNVEFGKHRRTVGIYLAGALVRIPFFSPPNLAIITRNLPVCPGKLDVPRCSHPLSTCAPTL